jgi:hypothetical protein
MKPIDLELLSSSAVRVNSTEDTTSEIFRAGRIAKEQIEKAQAGMKIQADKKRKEVKFQCWTEVLLTSENIAMPNILGSYKFDDKCVSRLETQALQRKGKFTDRTKRSDPTTGHGGTIPWIMEKIVDVNEKNRPNYLVKWKDYPEDQNTWELASQLQCHKDLIKDWNRAKAILP